MVVLSTTKILKAGEGPGLESRVRRLENGFSRMMSATTQEPDVSPTESIIEFERKTKRDDIEELDESDLVDMHDVREVRNNANDMNLTEDKTQNWLIEFECPSCETLNTRGIEHDRLHKLEDEFYHRIYLNCLNCGWISDPINIKGMR